MSQSRLENTDCLAMLSGMSGPKPTVPELLALLEEEPGPEERAELLAAAESAALEEDSMCASYLILVATAHVNLDDRDSADRLLKMAMERAEDRVWDYRRAAQAWLEIGDPASAASALETYERVLRNEPGPGYLWRLLAEGYTHDLGNADGAARCLARAAATAESVDDHCSVATGLWELAADRDGAAEALSKAEERAEQGDERQAWWTIANAYSRIGDQLNVRSTLLRGSDRAQTIEQHLVMAAAWQSQFPGVPEAVGALRAAQQLATTAAEFLEVAEGNHEHSGGARAVRECLEAAFERATERDELSRIARGFRQWLDDPERAAQIAPAGVRPDEVAEHRVRLEGWEADAAALLDWLRPQMNQERLLSVARADYGMEADRHLIALREIVETGLIPQPLDWHPGEVLHLTRWGQGIHVDQVERAFACAVLCIAEVDPFERSDADAVILLESCLVLGDEAITRLPGLFVALVEATTWRFDDDIEFATDAVLALLLTAGHLDPADPRLDALAETTLDAGGLHELLQDSMRAELWQRIAADVLPHAVLAQPDALHLADLARQVERLGSQ